MKNKPQSPQKNDPQYLVYEEEYEELYPRVSFAKKLLIYALVLLLLIAASVLCLWNGLRQYEAAQPDRVIESYITAEGQTAFYHALMQIYPDAENIYEPVYDIAGELFSRYIGKISYTRLVRESTYENPVYLLQSNGENLLKVTLEQKTEPVFAGLPGYGVRSAELVLSEALSFTDYGIVFPAEAEVYINGKQLNVDAATQSKVFRIFGESNLVACLPGSFFSRPTVRAFVDGEEIFAKDGKHFIFDPQNELRTLHITAPEGATVRIDGVAVSDLFVTGKSVSEADALGVTLPMTEYTVPTVCGRGAVTVAQDGIALQTETVNEYVAAWPHAKSATIRIPPTAVLYADGTPLATSFVTDMHAALLSELAGMRNAPESHTYVLDRLYTLPTFTATDGGQALVAVSDGGATVFVPASDEALQKAHSDTALAYMQAYLHYTTQGYVNTRANLDALQQLVDAKSPLHANLERSLIGYQFASPQKVTVDEITAENFRPLGADLFSCDIAYKLGLANFVGRIADENTLRITFAKQADGAFLAVAMTQIGK